MLQRVIRVSDRRLLAALGRNPELRWGGIVSGGIHVIVFAALLFGMPLATPEEPVPEEQAVSMVFDGTEQDSLRAPTPSPTPAPACTYITPSFTSAVRSAMQVSMPPSAPK